jgi:hypothetical protein
MFVEPTRRMLNAKKTIGKHAKSIDSPAYDAWVFDSFINTCKAKKSDNVSDQRRITIPLLTTELQQSRYQ